MSFEDENEEWSRITDIEDDSSTDEQERDPGEKLLILELLRRKKDD